MQARRPDQHHARSDLGSLQALLWTLGLGVFWILIEFLQILSAQPVVDLPTELGRLLRYLPWQLAIFALIGLPLAGLVRWTPIGRAEIRWLSFGAALLAFLGAAAALGAYRAWRSPTAALAALALVAVAITLVLGLFAAAGRALPGRLREAWPTACLVGGSFVIVPLLSRSSAPLRLGKFRLEDHPAALQLEDWVAGLIAGALTLALVTRAGGRRRQAVACLPLALGLFLGAPAPAAANDRPDVIVILIDALRADAVGPGARARSPDAPSPTPSLDAIAHEGIVFDRAYSAANRTLHSLPALMTSLSAAVVGESVSDEARTLAEYLQEAGYSTIGISTNPYISAFYGYDQGFDVFQDPTLAPDYLVMNPLKVLGQALPGPAYHWGLISARLYYGTAAEVRARAVRSLKDATRPTFLYLHTMDLHGPYMPPKRFLPANYEPDDFTSYYELLGLAGKLDGSHAAQLANARQRYEGELRFTDEEIGRLVEQLRSVGRWGESLVWILADHGEAFGEHGWVGHSGHNVFETLLHVPMILKPPRSMGLEPGVVSDPVATVDVLPTTLAMLGLRPSGPLFGVQLVDPGDAAVRVPVRTIVSDGFVPGGRLLSGIEGRWQVEVFVPRDTGVSEVRALFDLETAVDQRTNVASVYPETASRLADAIRTRLADEERLSVRSGSRSADPELLERLRELGYVDE